MWEHAKDFIGIPAAIKACLEVVKILKEGRYGTDHHAEEIGRRLSEVQSALKDFTRDALELEAIKYVHTLTNDITAVRFAEPGFPKSRRHIRDFDGSLLGRI